MSWLYKQAHEKKKKKAQCRKNPSEQHKQDKPKEKAPLETVWQQGK